MDSVYTLKECFLGSQPMHQMSTTQNGGTKTWKNWMPEIHFIHPSDTYVEKIRWIKRWNFFYFNPTKMTEMSPENSAHGQLQAKRKWLHFCNTRFHKTASAARPSRIDARRQYRLLVQLWNFDQAAVHYPSYTVRPLYIYIFIFIHQWTVERMQYIQNDAITLTTLKYSATVIVHIWRYQQY